VSIATEANSTTRSRTRRRLNTNTLNRLRKISTGLLLSAAIAGVAEVFGHMAPIVGAPVFAILLGATVRGIIPLPTVYDAGITFTSKRVLQLAIVVLGFELSIHEVISVGLGSLPVMLGTLGVCLIAAAILGRFLKIPNRLTTLIGVGTGICGASAIAATSAVIEATGPEIAYAISTIFTFNVIAVVAFPLLGHLMGLSQHAFGLWSGTAINDTSSVTAAGYAFGRSAGDYAIVVKLTRTLMIVPIVLGLSIYHQRKSREGSTPAATPNVTSRARNAWHLVPGFIVLFLVAVGTESLGIIPKSAHHGIATGAIFLITMALAAVGLSTKYRVLRQNGLRPLFLGAILWVLVALSSLGLQVVTGKI